VKETPWHLERRGRRERRRQLLELGQLAGVGQGDSVGIDVVSDLVRQAEQRQWLGHMPL
jgi:hypothetical protein